ncbi:DUF5131 family protein [uncultured Jatrophihabitans sp.]|uniref:DUF5131 family protein n=1 Tax=uncultured Jatrophihabitans sp. TaxID=1610747 RepID=UPI0035CAAC4C
MSTTIEWTDETWNPVTGCTKVSAGCDHCYAETFAERWRGTLGHHFENGFDLTLRPERLEIPLRWKRPRRVFVNSMSDLFHDDVPDEFIARVFAVMALSPRHTFQLLTKRHGRMRSLLSDPAFTYMVQYTAGAQFALVRDQDEKLTVRRGLDSSHVADWPLPNVWLGVSVETQQWADIRIPALLDTPAAVRFLSCEPLLGPVRLDPSWLVPAANLCSYTGTTTEDHAALAQVLRAAVRKMASEQGMPRPAYVDWVIAGGESGHGARPMDPAWARALRDQCEAAGVAFLFKQWGGRTPKANGRELDGRTWDQYPQTVTV